MDKDTKIAGLTLLAIPTVFVLFLLVLIPLGFFNAWVTQKLYGWFVIPLGAPHINLFEVWGLALIINRFTSSSSSDKSKEKVLIGIAVSIVTGLLTLLVGYILKAHIRIGQ